MESSCRDDVTSSPIQKMGIQGSYIERGPSRFTRDLKSDDEPDITFRIDIEGNDRTKRQLSQYLNRAYSWDVPTTRQDESFAYGSYGLVFYAFEIAQAINLQKDSLGIITIADVDKLFFRVVSQFAETAEVLSIHVSKHLEEIHFFILLSNKDTDEAVLFPLFDKESTLHDLFPDQFFTFHYLPAALHENADYVPNSAELIFGRKDV